MKVKDILTLMKDGKKPMVRLTSSLWDDSWGGAGMLARITSWNDSHDSGLVDITFDYNEQREHNLGLQSHSWFIGSDGKTGTAFEAGHMDEKDIKEDVTFDLEDDVPVVLTADNPILAEYLKSGSTLTYVAWLEKFIEDNVPNCMKPWEPL